MFKRRLKGRKSGGSSSSNNNKRSSSSVPGSSVGSGGNGGSDASSFDASSYGQQQQYRIPRGCLKKHFSDSTATITASKRAENVARTTAFTTTRDKRSVRFLHVHVREYERIIGDNPSCSNGAPISIGWKYGMDVAMPLDEYERTKPWEPRSGPALALSRQDREELLVEWGATFYDIIEAIRANIKAKNQRRRTVHAIGTYDRWEEVMENASRKIKRTLTLKKPKKIEDSTPKPISRYRGDLSSNQSSVRSLNSISQMMMIMIPDAVEFPDGADAVADGIRSIIPPKSESPREENDKTAAIAQQSEMSSAVQPQSEVAPKPPQRRHTPPSYQMENFSVASSTTLDDLSSFGCSSRKAAAYAATSSHSNIKEVVIEMDAAVGVQSARVDDDDDDTTLPSIYGLMDRYCEEETTLPFIVGSEKRRPSTAEDEGSADTFDANYNSTAAFVLMQNNHDNASSCSTLEVDEDDDDDDDDAFMILEGLSIASRTSGFTSEYQSSHSIVSNGDGNFENLKRDSSFWELCPGQQDSPAIQRKAAPVIISEDMNYGFNANMYGGQQPQPTYDRAAVTGRTALPTTYNVVDGRYWENGFTMQPPPNSSSLIMKWE